MKKELIYVALFISLALIAVSVLALLKVYYDDQAYVTPVQEPVFHDFCGTEKMSEEQQKGKEPYNNYCSTCHGSRHQRHNTLVDITRRFDEKFLISFIRSEDKLMAEHDTLTAKINEEWGGNQYTHKFKLTPDEVKAVLRYLDVNH